METGGNQPLLVVTTSMNNATPAQLFLKRAMYMDAEARKAELMKDNKLGNFIRSTSLDEFPQFFNVLKGVGGIIGGNG